MQKADWFRNETMVGGGDGLGRQLRALILGLASGSLNDLQAATRRERMKFEMLQHARSEAIRRMEASAPSLKA